MFPVSEYDLTLVPFNLLPQKYQLFLRGQYKYCLSHIDKVKALSIYNSRTIELNEYYIAKCCDFKLLEQTLANLISNRGF
jgi:hypothetical protein